MHSEWETWHEQGFRAQLRGDFAEARQCYEQALAAKPDYAFSRLALGQMRMLQSAFRDGREWYEARFEARADTGEPDWRALPIARWRGEPLAGKRIYLWAEQGLGDAIMFAAFLPHLLAQSPMGVTLGMFPKMMTLLARSFPSVRIESLLDAASLALAPALLELFPRLAAMAGQSGAAMPLDAMRLNYEKALARGALDYAAPMGDLMVYGLPDYIPAQHQAYLVADPERMRRYRERPDWKSRYNVGISWHSADAPSGEARSIPLAQWTPILTVPGCRFFSLQHRASREEMAGRDIVSEELDTEALAALAACMDEIITIDNSSAHLAGALGVPATLMLAKGCDFRWPLLENGTRTLWYGSVRAERQETAFDWPPVIARVARGLRKRTSPSSPACGGG